MNERVRVLREAVDHADKEIARLDEALEISARIKSELHAQVKALEADVAALKAAPAVGGWVDRERYSFRDDGKVLRVAESDGATWVWGSPSDGLRDATTLAEAKASLDAWRAPAKVPYTVKETLEGWCVVQGSWHASGAMRHLDAENYAAVLNHAAALNAATEAT